MKTMKFVAALSLAGALGLAATQSAWADTKDQDKTFVKNAGEGNEAEVQMAYLALHNSKNPDVLNFAKKMIHDHEMLQKKMAPFAMQMGIKAPTMGDMDSTEKDEYKRLEGKKGEEFDKDYIPTMVADHTADVAAFQKEYDTTDNPKLKAAVGAEEGVVKEHLALIEGIAHKYNLPAPS